MTTKGEEYWGEFARAHGPWYDQTAYDNAHTAYLAGYNRRSQYARVKQDVSPKHRMMVTDAALNAGFDVEKLTDKHILIRSKVTGKTVWNVEFGYNGYLQKVEGFGKLYQVSHVGKGPTARQLRDEFIATELA